jgi:tetratricopeptide (TPR) repeat protein
MSIDEYLAGLENLDLIRQKSLEPDLEYIFKHALTQEVVYNGLLKKERQTIHERIAIVVEELFKNRLPENYETLAFHFQNGISVLKAIEYLVKSGEKSIKRYAVEEAHQYFLEAYNKLNEIDENAEQQYDLILEILIKWAHVFYYRGDFKGMHNMFHIHETIADSAKDKSKAGMFYAWLGQTYWAKEDFITFERYLRKALALGEKIKNEKIIGYSNMYLSWNAIELGKFKEAVLFGEIAMKIANNIQSDQFLYFNSLAAIGYAYWYKGEKQNALDVGKKLITFGAKYSNIRSSVMGYFVVGNAYLLEGNLNTAITHYKKALEFSSDPLYSQFPRLTLGMSYTLAEDVIDAERELKIVSNFGQKYGVEILGRPADTFLGIISIVKGDIKRGLKIIHDAIEIYKEVGRKPAVAILEHAVGKIYFQLMEIKKPINLSLVARNIGFLIRNLPVAGNKSEKHLNNAIRIAQEIGANGILGQAILDLGILQKRKNRNDKARESLERAIQLFEQSEADVFLKQAKDVLESLT